MMRDNCPKTIKMNAIFQKVLEYLYESLVIVINSLRPIIIILHGKYGIKEQKRNVIKVASINNFLFIYVLVKVQFKMF